MKLEEFVTTFAALKGVDVELNQRRARGRHDIEGFQQAEATNIRPSAAVLNLADDSFAEEITEIEVVRIAQATGDLQAKKEA
jgi:hypothetical protein